MNFETDSEILKALGHPVRLQIVEGLCRGPECNVNSMVDRLKIPQSTVSQHLGILKNRGIITARKNGVQTCYFLSNERVKKILADLG
jgi:DNA-binding transcriptional ArsR family regulator